MRRFHARAVALLWSLIFALAAAAQAPPAPQPSSETQQSAPIRVSVDRVNVGVFVTDSSGKFVEGLSRESFHIFDNGIEQPITDFLAVEEPAQVLMFIEAGPAVYLPLKPILIICFSA